MNPTPPGVLWIKVEKPVFDLWGVIVTSLSFTGMLALGACLLGSLLGLVFILRHRRAGEALVRLSVERP